MSKLEDQLLQVTKVIEKQVDAAIEKIENLDVNDIENIRQQRIKELKEKEQKRIDWLANGHGQYDELKEEKQFFEIIKKSDNIVLHFYTNTNERSRIVDMHMKKLAPKHIETLFTKINAEKSPFLSERLKIKIIPTIVCIQKGILVDKIIGFSTLGNRDDFTTDVFEWRIAQNQVIEYEGDLTIPPGEQVDKSIYKSGRKIRSGIFNGEDDDLDVEEVLVGEKPTQSYELTAEEEAELGL
ncbi:thioredoxin domain-containing protein 9 [Onthophagus taurus]|uniref:thioredoxin domain-containing protein 9 n=1 Tax=Onthophagus taurus TaxID=166361 RepID=UPI000C202BD1|nr:thioredoxin domain-containing protein 9 [Onthophagus taurus]